MLPEGSWRLLITLEENHEPKVSQEDVKYGRVLGQGRRIRRTAVMVNITHLNCLAFISLMDLEARNTCKITLVGHVGECFGSREWLSISVNQVSDAGVTQLQVCLRAS